MLDLQYNSCKALDLRSHVLTSAAHADLARAQAGTHATATATPSGPPALISHIYSGQRARRQESTRAHLMLHINTSICAARGLSRLEAGMRAPFSSPCPAGSKQFCQRGCCSLSTRSRAQKLWLTRRLSLIEMQPVSAPHGSRERSCARADLLWKSQTEGPQWGALPLKLHCVGPNIYLTRGPTFKFRLSRQTCLRRHASCMILSQAALARTHLQPSFQKCGPIEKM